MRPIACIRHDAVAQCGRSTVLHTSPMLIWAVPSPDGTKIAFPDATINSIVWSTNSHL